MSHVQRADALTAGAAPQDEERGKFDIGVRRGNM
jgi:hypothetical protein